jgi:hypothetical protein
VEIICSVVLELLHEDEHTHKANVMDTSINFPFKMCQNDSWLKKNDILNIKYVAYESCNLQNFMFLRCNDNTAQSSKSLRYDYTTTLHNMFLLQGTVRGHEHAKRPQYTAALHISPCPSEQAARPDCSAVSFLSPAPLQCLQTAQTAKSDCLVV